MILQSKIMHEKGKIKIYFPKGPPFGYFQNYKNGCRIFVFDPRKFTNSLKWWLLHVYSIFRWQKINFKTSQFNHFAFWRKSMTYDGHYVAKVFFVTRPTNPIWVRVQRISSFFLSYCKQKFYHHFCKAWGFMLQNQGNMPWCSDAYSQCHYPLSLLQTCKWCLTMFVVLPLQK